MYFCALKIRKYDEGTENRASFDACSERNVGADGTRIEGSDEFRCGVCHACG